MPDTPKLEVIQGAEVFAVGNHRGIEYTSDDLNQIVANFERLCTGDNPVFKPTVVVGHEEDQKLIEGVTGYPASGIVLDVWREGDKLFACMGDIPPEIADLIRRRAYRQVSVEIYDPFENQGQTYGKAIRRIALLGAEMPQVKSLADLPMPTPAGVATFADGGKTRWTGKPGLAIRKSAHTRWHDALGRWYWTPTRAASKFRVLSAPADVPRLTPAIMRKRVDRILERRKGIKKFSERDSAVIAAASPAVVQIECGTRYGSGFIAFQRGDRAVVVTNAHVAAAKPAMVVRFADGRECFGALAKIDLTNDLAAIVIYPRRPVTTIKLFGRLPLPPKPGDDCLLFGSPLAIQGTTSRCMIAATGRAIYAEDGTCLKNSIQISGPILPGNSGGPLLNTNGELIGLACCGPDKTESIGFCIPAYAVRDLVERVVSRF